MGKCISGLSGDPICPYGDLGVEQVVPLVRRLEKCLEPCCTARHPAAHDIIAAAHCIIDADAPSPRYARERATLVLLRFVRSDWSWESDLPNQALQPHGAGNALGDGNGVGLHASAPQKSTLGPRIGEGVERNG